MHYPTTLAGRPPIAPQVARALYRPDGRRLLLDVAIAGVAGTVALLLATGAALTRIAAEHVEHTEPRSRRG